MPLPPFAWLADNVAALLKSSDEIGRCGRDPAKELVEERPEEPERSFLELNTATMEEERENEGIEPNVRRDYDIVEGMSQKCRLPRAGLSLDPEQAMIASGPTPIHVVSKWPFARPLSGDIDIVGPIVRFWEGQ